MTARLFVDRAFREWFRHAPRDATDGYRLSSEELDMVSAVDDERLAVYADSLKQRRREAIAAAYPLSRTVAGDDFERYADRYCDLTPGLPERERTLGFGDYLRECLEAETRPPHFAAELATYERHLVDLRGLEVTRPPMDAGVPSGAAAPRPRLAEGTRIAVFDYDIPAIVADLERTGASPAPNPHPTGVVMRRLGERTAPEIFRIEVRVAALLRRCTGERTLAALAEECCLDPELLAALLARLAAMRVITCQ